MKGISKHRETNRRRWVSGTLDADPFRLPASLTVPHQPLWRRMAGFLRYATIYRDRVKVQDSSPPFGVWDWEASIADYDGIALVVAYKDRNPDAPVILVELHHPEPGKSVILHASFDGADAGARWRSWSQVLGLPLLVEDRQGIVREATDRMGQVALLPVQPHRGASPLTWRRPMSFGFTGRPRQWSDRVSGTRPHAY
ncbi:MAG: DUF6101 family protein [Parvibaculum sp.]